MQGDGRHPPTRRRRRHGWLDRELRRGPHAEGDIGDETYAICTERSAATNSWCVASRAATKVRSAGDRARRCAIDGDRVHLFDRLDGTLVAMLSAAPLRPRCSSASSYALGADQRACRADAGCGMRTAVKSWRRCEAVPRSLDSTRPTIETAQRFRTMRIEAKLSAAIPLWGWTASSSSTRTNRLGFFLERKLDHRACRRLRYLR